jgi:hypothetical protein
VVWGLLYLLSLAARRLLNNLSRFLVGERQFAIFNDYVKVYAIVLKAVNAFYLTEVNVHDVVFVKLPIDILALIAFLLE